MKSSSNRWSSGVALALVVAWVVTGGTAGAENLLQNWQVDRSLEGWAPEPGQGREAGLVWVGHDPNGDPEVGTIRVLNRADHSEFVWVHQCIPAVAGARYEFGVHLWNLEDQEPIAESTYGIRFYGGADCLPGTVLAEHGAATVSVRGVWVPGESGPVTAPTGTRSASIRFGARRASPADGTALADFSLPYVEGVGGAPPPDDEGWLWDPAFSDFRFHVELTAGGSSRIGALEPDCIAETVCVSGAVAGRSEVFLRIVGPKPNGYLWPTLFKATTARVDVWIEQLSSGVVKHYVLPGASPGQDELPGLFDREGFLP